MTYNLHPLIVHFPIALLFLYSLIKILPTYKWFPKTSWQTTERFLLLVGTIGIFLAKASGEVAKDLTNPNSDLVEMHEFFANATTWFYVALVVIEFLPLLNQLLKKSGLISGTIFNHILEITDKIKNNTLIITLSLLGFLALFMTGLLGGVITYGVSADPIAPYILRILNIVV